MTSRIHTCAHGALQAGGEQQANAVLFLQVYARILEAVVQLDIYRAHIFSEAGEVKPYLRHLIDRLVALVLTGEEGGGIGEGRGELNQAAKGRRRAAMAQVPPEHALLQVRLEQALLQAASHMLLIDHTAVEPHAHKLSAVAMKSLGAAPGSGVRLAAVASAAAGAGANVSTAAVGFLSGFSQTMSRLNQGEKFVECFLSALRVHALPPVDPMLDPSLLALGSVPSPRFTCMRTSERPAEACRGRAQRSAYKWHLRADDDKLFSTWLWD